MVLLLGYALVQLLSAPVFAQEPQPVVIVNPSPTNAIWTVKDAQDAGISTSGWLPDEEVTVTGKRAERARQFINWTLDNPSIDNHPVFRQIWLVSAGTTLFLIVIVVAIMGLGVLLARKRDVSFNVDIVPIVYKTLLLILYIAFSYLLVLGIIQLTDVMMDFFIKTLGGDQLFKIFFVDGANSEEGYRNFTGARRIGMQYAESAQTSLFLIDFTSFTYFAMGIMIVLRKIVLWFLLVVSPFLAVLMPFIFIRNTGWIWIGVFFQWAFYGPLFALFLGALARIWMVGIPFLFDFQRAKQSCEPAVFNPDSHCSAADAAKGIVYPLAINIMYGGPAQRPGGLGNELVGGPTGWPVNSSNYVDTFAEYVISLVMLWVVIVLPWWLLRIFRDYCCEGIYAMRNILMTMMNNGGLGPQPPAPAAAGPTQTRSTGLQQKTEQKIAQEVAKRIEDRVSTRLAEFENIKAVQTERIAEKLEVRVSNVKEVAQFETRREKQEYFHRLSDHMKNPMSAEHPADRAAFTNLKAEMSQRAVSGDQLAQRILEATTANRTAVNERIQNLAQTRPAVTNMVSMVAKTVTREQRDVERIVQNWSQVLTSDTKELAKIAQSVASTETAVREIVTSLPTMIATTTQKEVVQKLSEKTNVSKEKVSEIIRESARSSKEASVLSQIVNASKTDVSVVSKTIETIDRALGSAATVAVAAVKPEVIKSVITSIEKLVTTTPAVQLVEKIAQELTISVDTVKAVIQGVDESALGEKAKAAVREVKKETKAPVGVEKAKELEVDELINEKDTLSLDEYEEIKQMWINHYLHGEVPVSETIKTREDWVAHDSVLIENILNKIISENEEVRAEGLKQVADSIPFFVLADMSISDIAVYLKAKRAAAKEVSSMLTREGAVKQRLQEEMEQPAFVKTTAGKEEKTHVMRMEVEEPSKDKSGESDTTQSR